jgi:hypothetical protein
MAEKPNVRGHPYLVLVVTRRLSFGVVTNVADLLKRYSL